MILNPDCIFKLCILGLSSMTMFCLMIYESAVW